MTAESKRESWRIGFWAGFTIGCFVTAAVWTVAFTVQAFR